MSTESSFADRLYSVGQYLYRGPLKPVVRKSGAERAYKRLLVHLMKRQTISVGEVAATFAIDTPEELFHLKNNFKKERKTLHEFVSNIQPDDVVYDIGANVGVYACLAGKKVIDGSTVAFEPASYNAAKISQNADANDVEVDVHEVALSRSNGEAEFVMDERGVAGSGHGSLKEQTNKSLMIKIRTGNSLVERGECPAPTVVKIDVEGAELEVIEGLDHSLEDPRCREIFVEVHPDHVPPSTVQERLEELGFQVSDGEATNRTHLYGSK